MANQTKTPIDTHRSKRFPINELSPVQLVILPVERLSQYNFNGTNHPILAD